MSHITSGVMTFPMTRQGVRDLDRVGGRVLPLSGGPAPRPHSGVNVGSAERLLSAAGGAALALFGLTRGTLLGLGLTLVGGVIAYRGLTGHCPMYAATGVDTSEGQGAESRAEVTYQVR
jgi:uncharacterized membrane protein